VTQTEVGRTLPVGPGDIVVAWDRISGYVRRTPVVEAGPGAFGLPTAITLKLELLQHTGSFKARGAFSKMLASNIPSDGVIAASGGNFGLAVAHAAGRLGHRCRIFVPSTSPVAKIDLVRACGAEVQVVEGYYDDAATVAGEAASRSDAIQLHPFDQPEVVAGGGTVGMELSQQVPDFDTVLVAVGGGGLIGGIAAWLGDDVRVVAVEPKRAACMHAALAAGAPIEVPVGGVAADALGPSRVGEIAFEIARRFVNDAVLVSDAAIVEAQRSLWQELRIVAEPGGATALAALTSGAYVAEPHERVAVLVCGGNCDPSTLAG
jgi:threonine dehydratase